MGEAMNRHMREKTKMQLDFERDCRRAALLEAVKFAAIFAAVIVAYLAVVYLCGATIAVPQ
jgi:hypothetical protein